jgi:hypothetical protein
MGALMGLIRIIIPVQRPYKVAEGNVHRAPGRQAKSQRR